MYYTYLRGDDTMSNRELAIDIVKTLSDEQIKAFLTLFASENIQAMIESDSIAHDETRRHYDSFDEIEKVIFADE